MKNVDKFMYHVVTGTMEIEFEGEVIEKIKLAPQMSREEVEAVMAKRGWTMGDDFMAKTYSMTWYLY